MGLITGDVNLDHLVRQSLPGFSTVKWLCKFPFLYGALSKQVEEVQRVLREGVTSIFKE
jgi:hypothetical protein